MAKLKLGPIVDDKPMKVTVELSASLHRNLATYVDYLNGQHVSVAFSMGDGAWRI